MVVEEDIIPNLWKRNVFGSKKNIMGLSKWRAEPNKRKLTLL